MDKFIKILLLGALIKASSLYAAMSPEDQQSLPRLVIVAMECGEFENAVNSMDSQIAFQSIREYAEHPCSQSNLDASVHNQFIGGLYFFLFNKEGGWGKIRSLGSLADLAVPKEAPLIVKSLHNAAMRFYRAGERSPRVQNMLQVLAETLKYRPSIEAFAEFTANLQEKRWKEAQALVPALERYSDLFGRMASMVPEHFNSESCADIMKKSIRAATAQLTTQLPEKDLRSLEADLLKKVDAPEVREIFHTASAELASAASRPASETKKAAQQFRLGDVSGGATTLTKAQAVMDLMPLEGDFLFSPSYLEALYDISCSIKRKVEPQDIVFFVGRSPLYIREMMENLDFLTSNFFAAPFSFKGKDAVNLDREQQIAYERAESAYIEFLEKQYRVGDLLKANPSRRFLAVDLYETGISVNKFCDLLQRSLTPEARVQIIALTDSESRIQKAAHDPRVLGVVQIPGEMIVSNDGVRGIKTALGCSFSWSEWAQWKDISAKPPFRGQEAEKLCNQIRDFANTKKIPGHS